MVLIILKKSKRFERWDDCSCKVKDNLNGTVLNYEDVVKKLNTQQDKINRDETLIKTMVTNMEKIEEENDRIKTKGLEILTFHESKLENVFGTKDFQYARDELLLVRFILCEMGVLND